jgi:hypothetical protein
MRTRPSEQSRFLFSASVCAVGPIFTLGFTLGCSAPVGATTASAEVAEGASSSSALVLIERTVSSGDSARAEAVARFLRMHAGSVDDDALRMVGAAVDFPAVGACDALSSLNAGKAADPEAVRAVELVDVGSVSIETNGVSLSLPPRRLPDILELVSGVVYSTRAPDPEALPSGATYVLRASGRASLSAPPSDSDPGPFVVSAVAPVAIGDADALQVGGQVAKTSGPLALSSDAPVELVWSAGNPQDVVYVDVSAASGTGSVSSGGAASGSGTRCMFADTGHAVLPEAVLLEGDGNITIHRLHREFFQARGIDSGEIRFDFARVLAFHRQ